MSVIDDLVEATAPEQAEHARQIAALETAWAEAVAVVLSYVPPKCYGRALTHSIAHLNARLRELNARQPG